tara:strand:+ start:147027 stop:149843 length:2817 start_codon:yes stop_codon:yes gene_type:complete
MRNLLPITNTFALHVLLLLTCTLPASQAAGQPGCAATDSPDDCLRLNQVQVLGSHNSYKRWPAQELIDLLDEYRPGWARDISYEHRPLREQLALLGLRQFELDVFADPDGGLHATPAGGMLINDPEIEAGRAVMSQPGFKVLHSQDVDYRTTCLTLRACLTEVRDWSLANPTHLPVMIMLELKDGARQNWGPLEYTVPASFTEELVVDVDSDIWAVFDRNHVLTPDDVRGESATLEAAILTQGWPTLAQSRGKILFAMDNTGRHRDLYLQQSPNLENRAMFVSMNPGHPVAAFIKMNNAIDDHEQIRANVARGYLVRTRSDVPSHEARTGDTTRRELGFQSGAQYISTDYAEPSPFGSGYQAQLPDGPGNARCNPVSAPTNCNADWLTENVPAAHISNQCGTSNPHSETARGRVYLDENNNGRPDAGEPGIPDVRVSNGCEVVQTNAQGEYEIQLAPADILFISQPSGFRAPVDEHNIPKFFYLHYPDGTPTDIAGTAIDWQWEVIAPTGPLPAAINFALISTPDTGIQFDAHAFADTQARTDLDQDKLREDLINPLIGNPHDVEFGITVGDVVYDNLDLYDRHKAMMALMGIPQWYLPGNHDINFESPDAHFANETYKRHFGPTYYSFSVGNVHFVALNNVEYAGADNTLPEGGRYRGYISENQLYWLQRDLATVDRNKLIVIATHIPLISEAIDDSGSEPATGPSTVNFDQLIQLLLPFENVYAMAGHDTSNSWKVEINHTHDWQGQPWIAHTLAEVRGNGWQTGPEDLRGVNDAMMQDGNPNGYYVLHFDDTEVVPEFIPFPTGPDAGQRMRITIDPPLSNADGDSLNRGIISAGSKVVVNLFDGGVRDQVWLSLNGQTALPMRYTVRTDPYVERAQARLQGTPQAMGTPQRSAHIWELELPDDLPVGVHRLTVNSVDEFGQRHESHLSFEVQRD